MVKLMKKNTDDGAKIYTPLTLKLYDWWVLGVSNRLAWGCPTKEHLLPHFLEHLGNNHLDIGVGTGFYLTHVPESSLISLMDLNEASLNAASTRAGESKIKHKISHDVFEPYPAALHGQFDSISMFYLLHCLPGNISTKSCVIRNAAQALTDDGTLSEQMEHQRLRSGRCASTARHHGYQLVVVQELKISVSMTSDTPGQAG